MNNEWIVGIITGIISSALIFFFTILINKVVIPRVYGVLQRVPNVSGKWEFYDTNPQSSRPVGYIDVAQRGADIKAKIIRNLARDGNPSYREFTSHGKFHSGKIVLMFEDIKAPGYIIGAVVCQLNSRADEFDGKSLYIDHHTGQAVAYDVFFKRTA